MSAPIPQAAFQNGADEGAKVRPPCMCPHCGYNFEADRPIASGNWVLFPHYSILDHEPLRLTRSESGLLYTLAKARGDWVTTDAILNRISDSERPNIVSTLVADIRKKLGARAPIASERGQRSRGYRWTVAA